MKNNTPKYLIETDILVNYLTTTSKEQSHLLKLMQNGICFTSVFNASELFFYAYTDFEKQSIKDLLYSIKVLGLHSRYSLSVGEYAENFENIRDTLFFILAKFNNLIIVSLYPDKYSGLEVLSIHPNFIK